MDKVFKVVEMGYAEKQICYQFVEMWTEKQIKEHLMHLDEMGMIYQYSYNDHSDTHYIECYL